MVEGVSRLSIPSPTLFKEILPDERIMGRESLGLCDRAGWNVINPPDRSREGSTEIVASSSFASRQRVPAPRSPDQVRMR